MKYYIKTEKVRHKLNEDISKHPLNERMPPEWGYRKKNLPAISFKKNDSIKTLAEDSDRHHERKDVDHRQYIKRCSIPASIRDELKNRNEIPQAINSHE